MFTLLRSLPFFQPHFAFRAAIRRASNRSQGKFTVIAFQVITHCHSFVPRVALLGQIKFIPDSRKLSSIDGSSSQHTPVQPALIAYYSEADAMRALESLDGNDSLSRGEPLMLEYMGKKEEEAISKG